MSLNTKYGEGDGEKDIREIDIIKEERKIRAKDKLNNKVQLKAKIHSSICFNLDGCWKDLVMMQHIIECHFSPNFDIEFEMYKGGGK